MTTPRLINLSLGLLVIGNEGESWFTANGGSEGYRAFCYAYLTRGLGAIVMVNSDAGFGIANEIINAIAFEYDWPACIPEQLR